MKILMIAVLSYLVGSINPAYILGKLKGFDIRKSGSGNAGASNAVITMGAAAGIFSALFDILKAYAVTKICAGMWVQGFALSALFCILGHIFPFYIGFRGGKGLACLGGVLLCYDPVVFLIALGIEAVLLFATDYLCLVPITGSVAFCIYFAFHDPVGAAIFSPAVAAILYRHIGNLKNMAHHTEVRFSYLWNKEKELERTGKSDPKAF